jgi:Flp pilus assembly protein TadG
MKSKFLTRFRQDREGTAIIEFAIVAPMLFLLLIGIIEVGLIFFTTIVLEGATNIGSRIGRTGYTPTGMTREDYIRSQIVSFSGGYLDPADLQIDMLAYQGFNNINQPEPCHIAVCTEQTTNPSEFDDINGNGHWDPDQGIAGAGNGRAIVLYRVNYDWPIFTPMMRGVLGDPNGNFPIGAIATVRNESFR